MPISCRAQRLRAYDEARRTFIDDCAARAEDGARIGGEDVRALDELASGIAGEVMAWRSAFARLDLARDSRGRRPAELQPERAGRLALEAVFDELLTPSAWRLLAAAYDLAEVGA
jgi:hypothetical protein